MVIETLFVVILLMTYATIDDLEGANETDVEVDGYTFRVRAAELSELIKMEELDDLDEASEEMVGAIQDLLQNCVVQPELETHEDVQKLGRFQMPLFSELMDFSMGEMDVEDIDVPE